ncbi:MAG: Dps family protein [Cyanobacteria bacterium J06597_16]
MAKLSFDIGLSEEQRQGVVSLLNADLADNYLLVIKTRKYHWDVIGPAFRTLHLLWDEQYEIISTNIDEIAERVRKLDGYPIGTAKGILENATLREHPGDMPNAQEMVIRLVKDHEQIVRNLRGHISECEEKFNDVGTADFLTGLMQQHEEMAWMLRSFLEGSGIEPTGKRESELKVPSAV